MSKKDLLDRIVEGAIKAGHPDEQFWLTTRQLYDALAPTSDRIVIGNNNFDLNDYPRWRTRNARTRIEVDAEYTIDGSISLSVSVYSGTEACEDIIFEGVVARLPEDQMISGSACGDHAHREGYPCPRCQGRGCDDCCDSGLVVAGGPDDPLRVSPETEDAK